MLRLTQMQLLPDSSLHEEIEKLKLQRGHHRQFKTIRGRIVDRKGCVLAEDRLKLQLCINYSKLTSFSDERFVRAKLIRARLQDDPEKAEAAISKKVAAKREDLRQVIDKCIYFGLERAEIEGKIKKINDSIWNLRSYLAWKRNFPGRNFEEAVPDVNDRVLLAAKEDIAEMYKDWPLLELETDDDIFTAQLEFMNTEGISILPGGKRYYPYESVGAQTIGWVGPAPNEDFFADPNDRLFSYLAGDVWGRRPGVEYVCEAILRGRRGEEVYNIDSELISKTKTQFGRDVMLTLDIELQKRIEEFLADVKSDSGGKVAMGAVVIDVASSNILALVSMPTFDLNHIRRDYADFDKDPNRPLINRAIYELYPPGSIIKPVILVAGIGAGKITTDEVISCPAASAARGWPNCHRYQKNRLGHDGLWQNTACNAIKGSCNIYFSRLADRIDSAELQSWLYKFGYGRKILNSPSAIAETGHPRDLVQSRGIISSSIPARDEVLSFDKFPLENGERRYFGIGQGNMRVTVLQVSNEMAVIARGGLYKPPRLFIDDSDNSQYNSVDINISRQALDVVYDGMWAVVNESGGTAHRAFAASLADFSEEGLKVYGKTGSSEKPYNALFAGFAEDGSGRSVALAIIVEGGQSGGGEAAPLACEIIRFCLEAGYIGRVAEHVGVGEVSSGQD